MSQTVLIFGANGQVGRELQRVAWPASLTPVSLARPEGDVTRPEAIAAAVAQHNPVALVNAAAYTAVDKAETEAEAAFAINRDGAANLARAAAAAAVPLIHISTDYVFDGSKPGAYAPSDPVAPLGVYGQSKEAGERAIRAAAEKHVILRTAWVFGPYGHNFVKTMLRLAAARPELRVVADQRGCPTPATAIADAIAQITAALLNGSTAYGTYHFAGRAPVSWHGFAEAIFAEGQRYGWPVPKVHAITTEDFPTPARRPANSVLDCSALTAAFGIMPADWRLGLIDMLAECRDEIGANFAALSEEKR
ncbi:dTDP-4-dehydrorhamnose reductase [Elstera litoralis]|uniref:dTDP-4-dehydrorhamnose reductase n=1 Tax=Elstera litoralis TaxID=552518 RepID=A0A0F3IX86_9PROT|nr:dTDP-4-dehydrorhamnose reductase [Elstera litoralis]KJV10204.1 dTDP-4-dehydrorhamnose reductase [Elstera litoralis]